MAATATSREWGMEQYVRDARIAMIYEGTNGVQAMDLVGRKLALNGGRAVQALFAAGRRGDAAGKARAGEPPISPSGWKRRSANCRRRRCG